MHIAIIADPIDKQNAGIFYYTRNLIIHLLEEDKKNKYSIIKLNKKSIHDINPIAHDNTITFLRDDPIRTFITLPKLIKKLNPDIVIEPAHFGPFNLPKHIKRVTVIHDLTPIKFPNFHKFKSQFLQRLFIPRIIKKADLLITNSKNTSNDLELLYPNSIEKNKSIYLGKKDIFKPTPEADLSRNYHIKSPYFLCVSTIEPRKNLKRLLVAYKMFRQQSGKKVDLVICGGIGWKSKSFFRNYFKHPYEEDIKLIGYVDRKDMPYLYSNALAFIFPSYYEGFGLPLLEAMACGTPCLASNTSSLPEVGGYAALYFNPLQAEEIAAKMSDISSNEDLRKKLSEKSINQAKQFSWTKYAQEFIQIIEEKFG